MRLAVMLPVTLALLAGCAVQNAGPNKAAAWPSLAPRAGEAMPMVVRRMATQRCAQPQATAACAPEAPAAAPLPALVLAEPAAPLEAALAALEADIAAAEAAVPAAQPPTGTPDASSQAGAEAAVAAGRAQLARAALAGIAIRAAELEQRLRDNPAGLPLQPRLAALRARIDRMDEEPDR